MKTAKEILKQIIIKECTDDYDENFSFYEDSVIKAMEEYVNQFRKPAVSGNEVALPSATVTSHQFYYKGKFHGFGNVGGEHKAIIEAENGTIITFDLKLYQITIHRGNDR